MWLYILVIATLVIGLLNTLILVFLAASFVNFREKLGEFFGDVVDAMEETASVAPAPVAPPKRSKTWDEKYEEELAAFERRIRGESGLQDLPEPTVNWGSPPAPSPQEGLTVRDK